MGTTVAGIPDFGADLFNLKTIMTFPIRNENIGSVVAENQKNNHAKYKLKK
jgi:hypothetical protein